MTDIRILLFLHLVGVSVWLGGQLLLVVGVVPALRGMDPEARRELVVLVGRRFGQVSGPALVLILVTGIWMAATYDLSPSESTTLQHKLEAVAVVLASLVVHVVAAARGKVRVSRASAFVTLAATLVVVWFATGL